MTNKDVAERIADLIPDSRTECVFKDNMNLLKSLLVKQSGLSEEEFEVEMEKSRIRSEIAEINERERRKGKFILWHNTVMGSREIICTENLLEVMNSLDGIQKHLERTVLDDDYTLQLPDGSQLWQTSILEWINRQ